MSILSRTSSKLFATLLTGNTAEEVALQFVEEYVNDPVNQNLQLVDLIFRSCGVTRILILPNNLIENEDIARIVEYVQNLNSSTEGIDNSIESSKLSLSKCFNKALEFFEYFWIFSWGDTNEEPFIIKLIIALMRVNINTVQFCCTRILSKLVTSILQKQPNNLEQQLPRIVKYARNVLVDSFFFKNRQLLKLSLSELKKWFELRPDNFKNDYFLCFVIWTLKEYSQNILLTGLDLVGNLLDNPQDLSERFLSQVCKSILAVNITVSNEIFTRVCNCCTKIKQNSDNLIPPELEEKLNDHLYSLDSNKCEAAADYWVAGNSNVNPVLYLRNVIEAAHDKVEHLEYFVDSLIDKCSVLTQWNLFSKLLADVHEEPLTNVEKDQLFLIVVYAVQRKVTGKRPILRTFDDTVESFENGMDEEASKNITLAFLPYLKRIFQLESINSALLLKLVSFFHFDTMPSTTKKNLIRSCVLTFQNVPIFIVRRSVVELMWKMKASTEEDIRESCVSAVLELKQSFESQAERTLHDFLNNYRNSDAGKKLSVVLLALRIIDAVIAIERSVAYDAAVKILMQDLPRLWNAIFMRVQETCVILATKYITRNLSETPDDVERVLRDAARLVIYLALRLKLMCRGRAGAIIFYSLCDIAKCYKDRDEMEKFPKTVFKNMSFYLLNALSENNSAKSCDFNTVAKQDVMTKYLDMIELDVLPMEYSYDALKVMCKQTDDKYEMGFYRFLKSQCEKRDTQSMTKWFFTLLKTVYEDEQDKTKLSKTCGKICQILYPVRSSMKSALYESHILGIDYATSGGNLQFVRVLSQFSYCLDPMSKSRVLSYLLKKRVLNTNTLRSYISSLKAGGKMIVELDNSSGGASSMSETSIVSAEPQLSYMRMDTGRISPSESDSITSEGPNAYYRSMENTRRTCSTLARSYQQDSIEGLETNFIISEDSRRTSRSEVEKRGLDSNENFAVIEETSPRSGATAELNVTHEFELVSANSKSDFQGVDSEKRSSGTSKASPRSETGFSISGDPDVNYKYMRMACSMVEAERVLSHDERSNGENAEADLMSIVSDDDDSVDIFDNTRNSMSLNDD